ncbi:excisionase family DNA binding protein [Streptomyces sp. SAI-126]|uniref:helix-turn-helix domain-containing protein n=1 Tax=Streptomyces sp. SAI-126 TaxID=3377732 RepID=UPI003C7C52EC
MPARLLSIPAVAAALDVDRRTVYRFIAAGDLPVVDLRTGPGRSRVRVPAAGLDELVHQPPRRQVSVAGHPPLTLAMWAQSPLNKE